MKTNQDEDKDKNFPRSPEKFPKTQTMPEGWSFTEFLTRCRYLLKAAMRRAMAPA